MKKTSNLIEDKRKDKVESQKAHSTSEFVIVAKNGGHALLCLASRLATVVSWSVSQAKL